MDWYIIAFISALLSAMAAILQKRVLFDLEALDFSLLLAIFNASIVVVLLPYVQYETISLLSLMILYAKTILGAFAFLLVMLAIKNMEISGALPLMILTPALVALLAYFILGESLSILNVIGMAALLLGVYILETTKASNLFESYRIFKKSKYKHYLLGAILLFTISSVVDKFLLHNHQVDPTSFLFFQQIFLAVNFFLFYLIHKGNPAIIFRSLNFKIFSLILVIALFTIGYRYALLESMKIAPVALVLSIKRTSIFFAAVIGGKLFSEHLILPKGIATILMLIGVFLIINL